MPIMANALPTKRFFIENIVRDLSLEDAILDLLDNCIDAYARTYKLDVSSALLRLRSSSGGKATSPRKTTVSIELDLGQFRIVDKCGGIDIEHAKHVVFRFGRPESDLASSLGVYGIGLKRAMFKIGRAITIESRTTTSGFRLVLDVNDWAQDDRTWDFPLEELPPAKKLSDAGTTITISKLNEEVALRLKSGGFLKQLSDAIARTYPLFLGRYMVVVVNGHNVPPEDLPLASSDELQPGHRTLSWNGVNLDLFAGLAPRDEPWASEKAGWYVLCNGRVVVTADKSSLTGWGPYSPTFQPKHRGFVGIAFFFSEDPAALPWTTTKRGLNIDSRVYQLAQKEMGLVAKPVLSFLSSMYPGDGADEVPARDLPHGLMPIDVTKLGTSPDKPFKPPTTARTREMRKTVSIQYPALRGDVERIKKRIGRPSWGASSVGKYTFDYYLKMELPE